MNYILNFPYTDMTVSRQLKTAALDAVFGVPLTSMRALMPTADPD